MLAIVDTGALYAAADADDGAHDACVAALDNRAFDLVIPALVVAEATYLIAMRMGANAEATFLRSLESLEIATPEPEDWRRISELVERYASVGLGGTDASIVALAERTRARTVITLDRRHFSVVRPRHCRSFRLLPDA